MTSRPDITHQRVLDLIEAYGSDPGTWPEAEREAAMALLRAQPARFEAALAEARMLDAAFAGAPVPDVPAGLAERILADAPVARPVSGGGESLAARLGRFIFPNGARWPAGATLAALLMGVSAGLATAPATAGEEYESTEEQVLYAALGFDSFDTYVQEGGE